MTQTANNETDNSNPILQKISQDISAIKMSFEKSQRLPYTTRFLQGIVGGFGTVIGATILVTLFVLILTQLGHIDFLKPIVERIIDIIQSKR